MRAKSKPDVYLTAKEVALLMMLTAKLDPDTISDLEMKSLIFRCKVLTTEHTGVTLHVV